MKELKIVFIAKLVRYNFGESFMSLSKEFESYPTEDELLDFLKGCNENCHYKGYETKISVDKIYSVLNTE